MTVNFSDFIDRPIRSSQSNGKFPVSVECSPHLIVNKEGQTIGETLQAKEEESLTDRSAFILRGRLPSGTTAIGVGGGGNAPWVQRPCATPVMSPAASTLPAASPRGA